MDVKMSIEEANTYIRHNADKIKHCWRPRYHLAGECGWINDPNGFIQYNGHYHQFYQHYPYEAKWGPMHWGHAVSEDLVSWQYLPVALAPDMPYDSGGCFSGSAIEANGILYLLYTGHVPAGENNTATIQTQCLASSKDGYSFEKYQDNPVIDGNQLPPDASRSDFRDPRVFLRNGIYYVLIGSEDLSGRGQLLLYRSQDLKSWDFVNIALHNDGTIGHRAWECPDLFSLADSDVLIFSPQAMQPVEDGFHNLNGSAYLLGRMDLAAGTFSGGKPMPLDYGFDFYAPQVLIDDKGRRIMTAWMDMWQSPMPTADLGHNWAGAMILPREITLVDGRLHFQPIQEIQAYRTNAFTMTDLCMEGETTLPMAGDCCELEVILRAENCTTAGLKLRVGSGEETILRYDTREQTLTFDRNKSGRGPGGVRRIDLPLTNGTLHLRLFLDKSSLEVFASKGSKVMSGRIYPETSAQGIVAFAEGRCTFELIRKWDLMGRQG